MSRMMAMAAIAFLGLSSPAWADGALAVGCSPTEGLVWGWEFGRPTTEEAAQIALQRCQSHGSDCTAYRAALNGDGAWIALADDVRNFPPPKCAPFGAGYSKSKQQAESVALQNCQKTGGRSCVIAMSQQNQGVTTYHIVPGSGGGSPSLNPSPARPSAPLCTQLPINQRYGSGCIP